MEAFASGHRFFLVKLHGSYKRTWEPEDHLDDDIEDLNDYLDSRNPPQPRTKIQQKVGSSEKDPSQINKANWVAMDVILEQIHKQQLRYKYPTIAYERFDHVRNEQFI